jgi:putative spermidine/putrescine transport system ATP-binding protein
LGISLIKVKKKFKDFNIDIDLHIKNAELVSLLGPSGCGKTTTIQLIAGILNPDMGSIFINNMDVTKVPVWLRNIGIVFQDYALFSHMNVFNNIAYGLRARKSDNAQIKRKVTEMLDLVHMDGYENRNIESLSGGEKQRVALARALAPSPKLLLLDEPLSALDTRLRAILKREIKLIQQKLGITTIYVTHDQDEALSISDRIILMNGGRVEQEGTPWSMYNNPETKFTADFLGDSNKIPCITERVSKEEGISLRSVDTSLYFQIPFRDGITKGASYLLIFRPQDTKIQEQHKTELEQNIITGRIIFTEYYGRYYAVKLRRENIIINTEISERPEYLERVMGTDNTVTVCINPEKCWLIKN